MPILTAEQLIKEGLSRFTAFSFVRLHLAVRVAFQLMDRELEFPCRAGAVLTGTRTSVIAGRVVLLSVGKHCHDAIAPHGMDFSGQKCSAICFVDNFYVLSNTQFGCMCILQCLEACLWSKWGLRFGRDSKMLMDCSKVGSGGSGSGGSGGGDGGLEYKPVSLIPCLGAFIAVNGSCEQCFLECRERMWKSFYANLKGALICSGLEVCMKWLRQNIMSKAAALWVTWPFTTAMAARLDKTQVHMICILMNYPHKPGINIDKYYRDRAILAGRHASKYGRWSVEWAGAVLRWHAHCNRQHDLDMWHYHILIHHDARWLEAQRLAHGHGILSRTRTRLRSGKVASRWSECLEHALVAAPAWRASFEHSLSVRHILTALLSD